MTRTSKRGVTTKAVARTQHVHKELLRHSKTKSCVLKTLAALNSAGVLTPGVVAHDVSATAQRGRHAIRVSANADAKIETPYGRVV